ncbi:Uncharacterised protein [Weissella viridescens]|uniref:Uncharacterized protein n=1 Tax=Weissella viridescens TaxID=1629 RepID=A0A380P6W0_WEIVI|nr:Uncharacterised protein [Weissella viridescens]
MSDTQTALPVARHRPAWLEISGEALNIILTIFVN